MTDLIEAYTDARNRLVALVSSCSDDELGATVPATPAWTVQDVVAHLCGVCHAYVTGSFPPDPRPDEDLATRLTNMNEPERARARDEWTEEMVRSRRDASAEQTIDEWAGWTDRLSGAGLSEQLLRPLVTDLAAHSHDIRGSLGRIGDHDIPAVDVAFDTSFFTLAVRVGASGLPPLRLVADGTEMATGEGDPGATMSGSRYELSRALIGRRSPPQVRTMFSAGDADGYLPLVSMWSFPAEDLED